MSACLVFGLLFGIVFGEDFRWNNREEVQLWYDNFAVEIGILLAANDTSFAEAFTNSFQMSDNFEEYVLDFEVIGKDEWFSFFASLNLQTYVKSLRAFYDVKYWHARHASAQFLYLYEFVDGAEISVKGEVTNVWSKKGELDKWIYFCKPQAFSVAFAKIGALSKTDKEEM